MGDFAPVLVSRSKARKARKEAKLDKREVSAQRKKMHIHNDLIYDRIILVMYIIYISISYIHMM